MTMIRRLVFSAVIVAFAVYSEPVLAIDGALNAIPKSAGVVIRLKRPSVTLKKLSAVAKNIDESYELLMSSVPTLILSMIGNPNAEGIDDKRGDLYVIVFPDDESGTSVVFGVPAAKPEEVEDAVRGDFTFIRSGRYVFYTQSDAAADEIQNQVDAIGEGGDNNAGSLLDAIDRRSRPIFDGGDVSVFINVRGLTERYDEKIDDAVDEINVMLDDLENIAPKVEGFDMGPVYEAYARLIQSLIGGVKDVESVTTGITFNTRGIDIEKQVSVTIDSDIDKYLNTHKTAKLELVDRLPADQLAYAAMHVDVAALTAWGMKFSMAMIADEERKQQLQSYAEAFENITIGENAFSFDLGDPETGLMQTTTISEVDPVADYRDLMRENWESIVNLGAGGTPGASAGLSLETEFQAEAETIDGHPTDVMTMRMKIDESADPSGQQQQMFDRMYGPEGMSQRMVYLDDRVVLTSGGGRERMEKALESLDSTSSKKSSGSSAIAKARKSFDQDANLLAFADLAGLFVGMIETMDKMMKGARVPDQSEDQGEDESEDVQRPAPMSFLPFDVRAIKRLRLNRSYAGFSIAVQSGGVYVKAKIPTDQLKAFHAISKTFEGLQLPGADF